MFVRLQSQFLNNFVSVRPKNDSVSSSLVPAITSSIKTIFFLASFVFFGCSTRLCPSPWSPETANGVKNWSFSNHQTETSPFSSHLISYSNRLTTGKRWQESRLPPAVSHFLMSFFPFPPGTWRRPATTCEFRDGGEGCGSGFHFPLIRHRHADFKLNTFPPSLVGSHHSYSQIIPSTSTHLPWLDPSFF